MWSFFCGFRFDSLCHFTADQNLHFIGPFPGKSLACFCFRKKSTCSCQLFKNSFRKSSMFCRTIWWWICWSLLFRVAPWFQKKTNTRWRSRLIAPASISLLSTRSTVHRISTVWFQSEPFGEFTKRYDILTINSELASRVGTLKALICRRVGSSRSAWLPSLLAVLPTQTNTFSCVVCRIPRFRFTN